MLDGFGCRNVVGLVVQPIEEFDLAFAELFADGDAVRDADEGGVFELDPSALVAVIEEDVDAGVVERSGDLLGVFNKRWLLYVGDGDDERGGQEQPPRASARSAGCAAPATTA